ncbi:MAG: hypothetical protein MJ116_02740, partial [Lachnospiraceae bacterium]|nr:hypothetical protein [Lachnospiraceae bacterium]
FQIKYTKSKCIGQHKMFLKCIDKHIYVGYYVSINTSDKNNQSDAGACKHFHTIFFSLKT